MSDTNDKDRVSLADRLAPTEEQPLEMSSDCIICNIYNTPMAELKAKVLTRLNDQIDNKITGADQAPSLAIRESLRKMINDMLHTVSSEMQMTLSLMQHKELVALITAEIIGYGPISPLLHENRITEIMINGPSEIYVEEAGRLKKCDLEFDDEAHLRSIAERIIAPLGKKLDADNPFVDARLPDGSRVNIIIPPISLRGTMITIRKFRKEMYSIEDSIKTGSLNKQSADFLAACVRGRLNIIISGGTGSGKTTLLNILSRFIPANERVITIEDSAELQLDRENIGILESRTTSLGGAVTIRQLLINSLRMRPDRIIIGEIRSDETFDMLQSMNTGHDGSMTTVHANSPRDATRRVETLALLVADNLSLEAIRAQFASAVNVIIQIKREADGRRIISHITEISGMEGAEITLQDIFVYEGTGRSGKLVPTGLVPKFMDILKARGIDVSFGIFQQRK